MKTSTANNLFIGSYSDGGSNFDGYMDEIRITKGKALWTSDFTPDTTPAAILDAPSSDQVKDNPTNNYATLNPLAMSTSITLSEGNLRATSSAGDVRSIFASQAMPTSGKYYIEVYNYATGGDRPSIGFTTVDLMESDNWRTSTNAVDTADVDKWFHDGANWYTESSYVTYSAPTSSSYSQLAIDMDSGEIWWGHGGTWLNSGDPEAGTGEVSTISSEDLAKGIIFHLGVRLGADAQVNFGQGSLTGLTYNESAQGYFNYAPPEGFKAFNVNTINNITSKVNASEYFDTILYTGNGAVRNITGLNFQPDLTWIKNRDTTDEHKLIDSLRGVTKELSSDSTAVEGTDTNGLTSFNSDGFELGTGASGYNDNTEDFVIWNWKENESLFDVAEFNKSGTGAESRTHNLGTTPDLMIIKDKGGTTNWRVWHSSFSNLTNNYLFLDTTAASASSGFYWGAAPSSSGFSLGNGFAIGNYSAYLFAEKEGFSKFGSYTGNGNADGPFIYTGFKPAYIMIKRTTDTGNWIIYDTQRTPYNEINLVLFADDTSGDFTGGTNDLDILSNGFKLRNSGNALNGNSNNYIYIAFAEKPLN
jgi:hypothetical protein